jgi:hypothetical protein
VIEHKLMEGGVYEEMESSFRASHGVVDVFVPNGGVRVAGEYDLWVRVSRGEQA